MTPGQLAAALASLEDRVDTLVKHQEAIVQRLDDLRDEVDALNIRIEASRAHKRRAKVPLVSEVNVCGLHPEVDSAVCPNANVYRFQQGCMGTSCVEKNRQYYADRRAKKRAEQQA